MNPGFRRMLAEAIGTFAIVFVGCGAIALVQGPDADLPINAAFGVTVAVVVYALGPISAAHFNPAVTLGFAVARRFPWRYVPAYVGSQLGGALLASVLHRLWIPDQAQAVEYGATLLHVPPAIGIGLEILLTAILMTVIMAVATDRRVPGTVPGFAIGATVLLCGLIGGPLTGCSMNPVRSLGQALLAGSDSLTVLPLYLFAPVIGALAAALAFERCRRSETHACCAPDILASGRVAAWPNGPCC